MTRHVSIRVPKTIETKTERTYRLEFTADTLRKRLKLPDDAQLFHGGREFDQPFDKLIVKYTRVS